jgi:hypothetical protein
VKVKIYVWRVNVRRGLPVGVCHVVCIAFMVVVFCENGHGFVWYCSDAGNVTGCGCIIMQVCLWVDVGFV